MRRFNIPMDMLDEPLRVETSIRKTARGQVQKVKYFRMEGDHPATAPTTTPPQEIDNPDDVHPMYDDNITSIPLHQRTSGKVGRSLLIILQLSSNYCRRKMTTSESGRPFVLGTSTSFWKQKPHPL